MAVPAFLFFQETGLVSRAGRVIAYTVCLLEMVLIAAIFTGVPLPLLDHMNSSLVIAASLPLLIMAFPAEGRRQGCGRVSRRVAHLCRLCALDQHAKPSGLCAKGWRSPMALVFFSAVWAMLRPSGRSIATSSWPLCTRNWRWRSAFSFRFSRPAFRMSAHFTVAARYAPMTAVAGDFYEFLSTEGPRAGLFVADVSGHGVPAALIASMVKIATSSQRQHAARPEQLLAGVNEALCGSTQGQFVTAAYVYLDAERGELCYAAAGHPPMLLLRDGQVCSIEENGLMLGVFSSAAYNSTKRALVEGDRLLLYTDGVIEAANGGEEEFGQERLGKLLASNADRTVEELADLILSTVQDWASTQTDDLTVVVCDYHRAEDL